MDTRTANRTPVRSAVTPLLLAVYCLVVFLAIDFCYSVTLNRPQPPLRIFDSVYHHGLAAKFDGYERWGLNTSYRFVTNSLGFRDFSTRDVPLVPTTKRVLLIGDSFTEAVGMTFDQSLAGLLERAGQDRPDKIEFLNAGVTSYSPVIYYKKIKYLLESGLRFDEVILLSDMSDVYDEATSYFCIDDNPNYRKNCRPDVRGRPPGYLETHFTVTNATRVLIKTWLQNRGRDPLALPYDHAYDYEIGWDLPDAGPEVIDVAGGIARSRQNMTLLADTLAGRGIPLTIVVYPWPQQLARGGPNSRQVEIWRTFCQSRCKAFIDLFPAFFAAKQSDKDWYPHLFIVGDVHHSAAANKLMFDEIAKRVL
jgi:hypothetical protein